MISELPRRPNVIKLFEKRFSQIDFKLQVATLMAKIIIQMRRSKQAGCNPN